MNGLFIILNKKLTGMIISNMIKILIYGAGTLIKSCKYRKGISRVSKSIII
jgi:hypothetical protein